MQSAGDQGEGGMQSTAFLYALRKALLTILCCSLPPSCSLNSELSPAKRTPYSAAHLQRQLIPSPFPPVVTSLSWSGAGLQRAVPRTTPFGQPLQVLQIGTTSLDETTRDELLVDLSNKYQPEHYNLLSHNCNNFSQVRALWGVSSRHRCAALLA